MSIPKHYSPVMPYIVLPGDADGFIGFIRGVFDAEEKLRVNHETGDMMHAEYSINGGTIMFGQAGGEWNPSPCGMFVLVKDVDGYMPKHWRRERKAIRSPATGDTAAPPDSSISGETSGG